MMKIKYDLDKWTFEEVFEFMENLQKGELAEIFVQLNKIITDYGDEEVSDVLDLPIGAPEAVLQLVAEDIQNLMGAEEPALSVNIGNWKTRDYVKFTEARRNMDVPLLIKKMREIDPSPPTGKKSYTAEGGLRVFNAIQHAYNNVIAGKN
jgi:hypothetical protein